MTEEDRKRFAEMARTTYMVCFMDGCPRRERCLRWLVGQQVPETTDRCICVNPRSTGAGTEQCPCFRLAQKVTIAKGMTRIFTGDMPKRVEPAVRKKLIARYNRTYYFQYRNGKQLIPPAMQQEIRQLFRQYGWDGEVNFDSYFEDYLW